MPGEKAKIVRGPVVSIRVTAPVDMAAGDFYVLAMRNNGLDGCVGFFPDAVKKDEKGTFIIAAHRVEIDRASADTDVHRGSSPVSYEVNGMDRSADVIEVNARYAGQSSGAQTRYLIGFVSDDTPADSDTIQFHFSGVHV